MKEGKIYMHDECKKCLKQQQVDHTSTLAEKDLELKSVKAASRSNLNEIAALLAVIAEKDDYIIKSNMEYTYYADSLVAAVKERSNENFRLIKEISKKNEQIAALEQAAKEKDETIANLKLVIKGKDALITIGDDTEHELRGQITALTKQKTLWEASLSPIEKEWCRRTWEIVHRLEEQIATLNAERITDSAIVLRQQEIIESLTMQNQQWKKENIKLTIKTTNSLATLTSERDDLQHMLLAGEPPYYTKWKEVTADNERLRRDLVTGNFNPDGRMVCREGEAE